MLVEHIKGKQRPLCAVCIKTRTTNPKAPAVSSPYVSPCLKLSFGLKNHKYTSVETGSFVNNDMFPLWRFILGHLHVIIALSNCPWFLEERQEQKTTGKTANNMHPELSRLQYHTWTSLKVLFANGIFPHHNLLPVTILKHIVVHPVSIKKRVVFDLYLY